MAIHTTDAIILREQDVRETSLLVVLFTRDFGKIRGLIKGARGPRGALGSQVQVFTSNRVVFYDTKRSGVHTVSHCDLLDFFSELREDIVKTSYACYFIELVDALTEDKDTNSCKEIYEALLNSLGLLKTKASPKRISRILEIRLLKYSGLMPQLERCVLCCKPTGSREAAARRVRFSYRSGGLICEECSGEDKSSQLISQGTVNFIGHIGRAPYEKLAMIKVSREVGVELEDVLKKFLSYRLEKHIKSLEFLEKVSLDFEKSLC